MVLFMRSTQASVGLICDESIASSAAIVPEGKKKTCQRISRSKAVQGAMPKLHLRSQTILRFEVGEGEALKLRM